MTRTKLYVVIITSFLLLTLVRSANATVIFGSQWYAYWEDYHHYNDELGGPENMSTCVRLVGIPNDKYTVNISLAVSVYDYNHLYPDDIVNCRTALYFRSGAPLEGSAVMADSVTIFVDKMGSNMNQQKAEFVDVDDPKPGSVQGYKLGQGPNAIQTTEMERWAWAEKAIGYAVAAIMEPFWVQIVAEYIVTMATSYSAPPNGGWWDNANWGDDTHGYNYWVPVNCSVGPGIDFIDQSCFSTIWWRQDQTEPTSYYCLAIRAEIVLSSGARDLYGTDVVITDPIYLQIKREQTGGCPYVYVWNGQKYVVDNNILPTSQVSNGSDVKDYYKLEQALVPTYEGDRFSSYSLQIREFENEHSYIDQAKLLAVDHASDVNIAITPNGEILTYKNPSPPVSCIDNNGINRLNEILQMDGNVSDSTTYFEGYSSDYLILNFGKIDAGNAKLILRNDWKSMEVCIYVQILDDDGDWQTVDIVTPRAYWSVDAVNLTAYIPQNNDFIIRLFWTSPHRLDYVGLDTTPQDNFTVRSAYPTLAIHSTEGNVRWKLLSSDNIYAELTPTQHITLIFIIPDNLNEERTFILYTEGHYHTVA